MKKTQRRELLRTIAAYPLLFISLVFIVAIAVALFCALEFSGQGMSDTADAFYKSHQFFDFRIEVPLGIGTDTLARIRETDGVTAAEASYEADAYLTGGEDGNLIAARFFSQPEGINLPTVVAGALPSADGDCAIELSLAEKLGISLGDTISLADVSGISLLGLTRRDFTVCGIVELPQALCTDASFTRGVSTLGSGQSETLVILPESSFAAETPGVIWVRTEIGESVNIFSDAYTSGNAPIGDSLTELMETLEGDGFAVFDTDYNEHYVDFQENLKEVEKLVWTSALLFLVLGSLVCMTIIDRMISDRRREVGIQKALGFRKWEIFEKYMAYCMLAVLLGVLIGVLSAKFILQDVIWATCYADWYQEMEYRQAFLIGPVLTICGIEIGLNLLIAFLSCRKIVSAQAVSLMRSVVENDTGMGAGIRGEFSRFPLQMRILLRGLFSNKKLLITIIGGVSACCILGASSITVRHSLIRALEEQYDTLQHYDYVAVADGTADEIAAVEQYLKGRFDLVLPVSVSAVSFEEATTHSVSLVVCEDAGVSPFITLVDIDSQQEISSLPETGILISRKLSQELGAGQGDSVHMTDIYGDTQEVRISAVYEWYLGHQVLMSAEAYRDLTGQTASYSQFFIHQEEIPQDALEGLQALSGFVSLKSSQTYRTLYEHRIGGILYITLIICCAAFLMTVFVVSNLAAMNLEDKKRELIIMGALGFGMGRRVWAALSDIFLISLIGLVLGAAVGAPAGAWLSKLIELSNCQNYNHISWSATAMAAAICFASILTANFAAAWRIRWLRLAEQGR